MAGEKPTAGGGDKKAIEEIIFMLVTLFFLGALFAGVLGYLESLKLGSPDVLWNVITGYFLREIWPVWKLAAGIVSAVAAVGIIYNSWQLRAIGIEEWKIYNAPPEVSLTTGQSTEEVSKK